MKICIFGGASKLIDKKYIDRVYHLSKRLATLNNSLVFGCGSSGLMGAAARGFRDGGAKIHGVIPKFFKQADYEEIFYEVDEMTETSDMAERKSVMENLADAFIVTPGGIGTMEEFFEVLTLKHLNRHSKAIIIYNVYGFYDGLEKLLNEFIENKLMHEKCKNMYRFVKSEDELIDYLNNYKSEKDYFTILKKE